MHQALVQRARLQVVTTGSELFTACFTDALGDAFRKPVAAIPRIITDAALRCLSLRAVALAFAFAGAK